MKATGSSYKNRQRHILSFLLAGLMAAGLFFSNVPPVTAAETGQVKASGTEPDKTETVYAKADGAGRLTETEVEVKLRKQAGKTVSDASLLTGIKNTDGDEEYKEGTSLSRKEAGLESVSYRGDTSGSAEVRALTWDNLGEAVRYKGKTDRELPVSVTIRYSLDGKEIRPEYLAGKSGHLKMRFDYENKTSCAVDVEGSDKPVETKVPFVAMTAALLPSDVFSSIEITNGRLLEMGSLSCLIGYAFPGFEDALRLTEFEESEDIELPEYVELEADVTDFELAFTTTIFSSGLFADLDLDKLDDIDDLVDSMDDLEKATDELADGSSALADGLREFQSYYSQYLAGADALGSGITAMGQGLTALNDNKDALADGAKALDDGLGQLNEALSGISIPSKDSGIDPEALSAAMNALVSDIQSLASSAEQIGGALPALHKAAEDIEALSVESAVSDSNEAEKELASLKTAVGEACAALSAAETYAGSASAAIETARGELAAVSLVGSDPTDTARSQAQEALSAALNDPSLISEDGSPLLSEEQKAALLGAVTNGISLSGTQPDTSEVSAHIAAASEALAGVGPFTPSGLDVNALTDSGSSTSSSSDVDPGSGSGAGADPGSGSGAGPGSGTGNDNSSAKEIAASITGSASSIGSATGSVTAALTDMQAQLGTLSGGLQSLSGLAGIGDSLSAMSGMVTQLQTSVGALKEGSSGLSSGFAQFAGGISELAGGGQKLASGFAEFARAGGLLNEGLAPAVEGAAAMADGIKVFNDEAISELTKLGDGELQDLASRIRALKTVDSQFETFSGLMPGQTGSVSFVIETAAIEK